MYFRLNHAAKMRHMRGAMRIASKMLVTAFLPALVFVQLAPKPARAFIVCSLPPGQITTAFFGAGLNDSAFASVLQPDGKIVLAGQAFSNTGSYFGVARYNPNGSLDPSFGAGGKATSQLNGGDGAHAVALQPDGKVVVAGSTEGSGGLDFRVARLNTDGSLDNSFGGNGSVAIDFQNSFDNAMAVAIQSDGKIVVSGYTESSGTSNIAVSRCNQNGSLDATFGSGGKVVTALNKVDSVSSMAIQPDGKIIVGGSLVDPTSNDFLLVRFNTDGSLDNSFGTNGVTTRDFFSGADAITALQLQPDGKIVAAGTTEDSAPSKAWGLARFNTDGTRDASFGAGSGATVRFVGDHTDDTPKGVALQPNGKIVVAGFCKSGGFTGEDFAVGRYNADGSVDTTFGSDGETTTDFCLGSDTAASVLLQPDGKIVAAGTTVISLDGSDFALVRYNADGSLDSTLNGVTLPPFNYCMRDNATGNYLQFNSTTGAYLFTRCKDGFTLSGTGKVQKMGSIVMLSDKRANCVVSAGFNTGQRTGSATVMLILAPGITQTIRINATNPYAACSCSG